MTGASAKGKFFSRADIAFQAPKPWTICVTCAGWICWTILRSARMVHFAEPSLYMDGLETGVTVKASEAAI